MGQTRAGLLDSIYSSWQCPPCLHIHSITTLSPALECKYVCVVPLHHAVSWTMGNFNLLGNGLDSWKYQFLGFLVINPAQCIVQSLHLSINWLYWWMLLIAWYHSSRKRGPFVLIDGNTMLVSIWLCPLTFYNVLRSPMIQGTWC